jgi:ribonuclease BN (tRNA processing enzyme)
MRQVGPFEVEARRVTHKEESYAFRVVVAEGRGRGTARRRVARRAARAGAGLVYSGDCGRAEDLLPLIRPGDTLLSEASFGGRPGRGGRGAHHLGRRRAGSPLRAARRGCC